MDSRLLGTTPYGYVFGNPLGLIDPDGRMPDCPECLEEDASFIGQIQETFQVNIKDVELPLGLGLLFGQTKEMHKKAVEGFDEGITATENVGDIADVTEATLEGASLVTSGATLPAAKIVGATGIGADLGYATLQAGKAYLTDGSYDPALNKVGQAFANFAISKTTRTATKRIVERIPNSRGAAFRSSFSKRFVKNYYGYGVAHTAPAAVSIAFFKTFFED